MSYLKPRDAKRVYRKNSEAESQNLPPKEKWERERKIIKRAKKAHEKYNRQTKIGFAATIATAAGLYFLGENDITIESAMRNSIEAGDYIARTQAGQIGELLDNAKNIVLAGTPAVHTIRSAYHSIKNLRIKDKATSRLENMVLKEE